MTDSQLSWYSSGTDEPGDQNADTAVMPHGYWSLGPSGAGLWSVELIAQSADLSREVHGGVALGSFPTEEAAKRAAEMYERDHYYKPDDY